jgi:hypothetical protein
MPATKIMLGYGTVTVGGTAIGLTRGGSAFVVEREYRQIEADGDKGPVVGRISVDTEVARLTVNALELFTAANMTKYYPAMTLTTSTTQDTLKSTVGLAIIAGDHADVIWTGKTIDGKAVTVTIEDAINMSNLEWTFEDKSEVVPVLEFTACWTDGSTTPPWSVVFAK